MDEFFKWFNKKKLTICVYWLDYIHITNFPPLYSEILLLPISGHILQVLVC